MKGFGGIAIALLAAAALFAFSGLGKRRDGTTAESAREEITRIGGDLPSIDFGEIFGGIPTRTGATARPTPIGEVPVIPLRLPRPGLEFDVTARGGTVTSMGPSQEEMAKVAVSRTRDRRSITVGRPREVIPTRIIRTTVPAGARGLGRAIGAVSPESFQNRLTINAARDQSLEFRIALERDLLFSEQ